MDYCLTQHKNEKRPSSEEIMIKFNKEDKTLVDYMGEDLSKRYVILISKQDDFAFAKEVLKGIKEKYPVVKIALLVSLDIPKLTEEVAELKMCGIDVFPATVPQSWTTFLSYIDRGFSDIYIGDELGFDLINVYSIAKENKVKIRVIPNYAFSLWSNIPQVKKFFIRPEDIDFYSPFIDVLEMLGSQKSNPAIESLLYKTYKKDKKWFGGSLDEIIIDLELPVLDGRYVHKDFSEKRIQCQRRCLKGGKCRICDKIIDLAKTLKDQGLEVKQIKKKNKEVRDGGEGNVGEEPDITKD